MGAGVWELVLFFCLSFSTMAMIDDGVSRSMSVMRFLETKIFACLFSNKLLYAGHTAYYIPRSLYYVHVSIFYLASRFPVVLGCR